MSSEPDLRPDASAGATPGIQRAAVNRNWMIKTLIIASVMLGFGVWGLIDALVIYPKRGFAAARYLEWQYLQKLQESNRPLSQAGVEDPRARLKELRARADQGVPLVGWELAQEQWLEALKNAGGLTPARTTIPRSLPTETVTSADERLAALTTEWTTASAGGQVKAPQPLTFYDIPTQWIFVSIGFPLGIYMIWLVIKVLGQKFTWDASAKRLTLPGGHTLGLNDIADFDKRKWHKFLIYVQVKPGHPSLGGQEICIDLLRHRQVEEWVLEMERTLFPDRAKPEEPEEDGEPPEDPDAPAGDSRPSAPPVERAGTP